MCSDQANRLLTQNWYHRSLAASWCEPNHSDVLIEQATKVIFSFTYIQSYILKQYFITEPNCTHLQSFLLHPEKIKRQDK